jgi:hypothetical protein
MTNVVTIQELQSLIPETKELEGKNFQDMKFLITSVIETVEKSGVWEFVQYIQAKPSLFVVRQKPLRSNDRLTNAATGMPKVEFSTTKKGKTKVTVTDPEPEVKQEAVQPESSGSSSLFGETTVPWK